ncbi:MAG: DNA recombination protein RmuC, partial [Gammaproteobacteria bacterium]|nr:DNA recombination protein RmuC [Gammaproteobacteria bacterium]
RAGALYDKVRVILEDMDQLGKSLGTAKRSYDSAYARLVSGKGNLVRQVEQFRELGADVKKVLPRDVAEAANEANP